MGVQGVSPCKKKIESFWYCLDFGILALILLGMGCRVCPSAKKKLKPLDTLVGLWYTVTDLQSTTLLSTNYSHITLLPENRWFLKIGFFWWLNIIDSQCPIHSTRLLKFDMDMYPTVTHLYSEFQRVSRTFCAKKLKKPTPIPLLAQIWHVFWIGNIFLVRLDGWNLARRYVLPNSIFVPSFSGVYPLVAEKSWKNLHFEPLIFAFSKTCQKSAKSLCLRTDFSITTRRNPHKLYIFGLPRNRRIDFRSQK